MLIQKNTYRTYCGKIYKKIKGNISLYIRKPLQSEQDIKEMYRQKSVNFTIGKTLYIENTHFWGKKKKKKEGLIQLYIRKHQ